MKREEFISIMWLIVIVAVGLMLIYWYSNS